MHACQIKKYQLTAVLYIFLGVFFTSIYMHKYITKYQFGITKWTQTLLYVVNVRYFFKYGNCRNYGTFIYDTVNQNTHKLCLTSNIRQNCHCVNTLSPKMKIKQRKTTILTPKNHNHIKHSYKEIRQNNKINVIWLKDIDCVQTFSIQLS